MKPLIRLVCAGLLGAIAAGCEAPAPTARSFNYLRLPSVSRADAFTAAVEALSERFRIARLDREAGVITSVPEERTEVVSRGRVGDLVGVLRRVRKVATIQVTGSDASAEVWCKVVVEVCETQEQRLFAQEHALDDLPTATAADRGGATTPEQNAFWRVIRRDKGTERALRRAINELLNRRQDARDDQK